LLPSLNLKILDMLFFYSSWVNAMHDELENFERNQVWTLVEPPRDVNSIGTNEFLKINREMMVRLLETRLGLLLKVLVK
jgi:hypothetical protein